MATLQRIGYQMHRGSLATLQRIGYQMHRGSLASVAKRCLEAWKWKGGMTVQAGVGNRQAGRVSFFFPENLTLKNP